MEKITINPPAMALMPDKVKELNSLGIDTSNCLLYWKQFTVGNNIYYSIEAKETFPNEDDMIDAPVYTDLCSILPISIECNGKEYFRTVINDRTYSCMTYCTPNVEEILHTEYADDMCIMAYKMIKWCIDNNYKLGE